MVTISVAPTTGRTYASVFVIGLVAWPLLILADPVLPASGYYIVGLLTLASVLSYVLNHVQCSSPVLSYWNVLCLVGGAWRTGILNISILIILPLLFFIHWIAFLFSLASLVLGKSFAQRQCLRLCYWGSRHKFDLAEAFGLLGPASE
jgi:hypothetical protein